jgi:hypothetical protein
VAGELSSADVQPAEVVKVALERLGLQASVMTSWFAWLRANLATRIGSRPLVAHAARGFMLPRTPIDMQ